MSGRVGRMLVAVGMLATSCTAGGDRGFGESCDFVSGNPGISPGVIEQSNGGDCASGYCLAILTERYCTQPCGTAADCPGTGTLCIPVAGGGGSFCVRAPETPPGDCTRLGDSCDTGLLGVCAEGLCMPATGGTYTCRQTGIAHPQDELGNGLDDDCDGQTDEGTPGEWCDTGAPGICRDGAYDASGVCETLVAPGSRPEVCDESSLWQDEDCDGDVDESDPRDGTDCDTGMPGVCAAGVFSCSASNHCEPTVYPAEQPESCNGVDDDCNGLTDDDGMEEGALCHTAWTAVLPGDPVDIAAGPGERTYVTTTNGHLVAVEATGAIAWDLVPSGELIYSPPLVSPDGSLIIVQDRAASLTACSAAGDVLWTFPALYPEVAFPDFAPDGTLYTVALLDLSAFDWQLVGLDATGTEVSRVAVPDSAGRVDVLAADRFMLMRADRVEVRDRTGALLWSRSVPDGEPRMLAPCVVAGGRCVAPITLLGRSTIAAFDIETGTELWRGPLSGGDVTGPFSTGEVAVSPLGTFSALVPGGDATGVTTVLTVTATGDSAWATMLEGFSGGAAAYTPAGDLVVPDAGTRVRSLAGADGHELWAARYDGFGVGFARALVLPSAALAVVAGSESLNAFHL